MAGSNLERACRDGHPMRRLGGVGAEVLPSEALGRLAREYGLTLSPTGELGLAEDAR